MQIQRRRSVVQCKNKDAAQLCSNCTADQRLCFRYTDSTAEIQRLSLSLLYTITINKKHFILDGEITISISIAKMHQRLPKTEQNKKNKPRSQLAKTCITNVAANKAKILDPKILGGKESIFTGDKDISLCIDCPVENCKITVITIIFGSMLPNL